MNEVVTALDRNPTVQASVVVAREETAGDKYLIAYLVPKPKAQLTDKLLREVELLEVT